MSYLLGWLSKFAVWLWGAIYDWFLKVFNSGIDGFLHFLNALPVPDFMGQIGSIVANVPPLLAYLVHLFRVPEGLSIIATAFTLRFIVKRVTFGLV